MLIVGELSEAEDALRKGDYAHIAEELADVVIRTADLAGGLGFDLEKAIEEKMERNKHRPRLHGKKF
jgi:NTP pyrophosphatase (non-canonical NTP hydrolase)